MKTMEGGEKGKIGNYTHPKNIYTIFSTNTTTYTGDSSRYYKAKEREETGRTRGREEGIRGKKGKKSHHL